MLPLLLMVLLLDVFFNLIDDAFGNTFSDFFDHVWRAAKEAKAHGKAKGDES